MDTFEITWVYMTLTTILIIASLGAF